MSQDPTRQHDTPDGDHAADKPIADDVPPPGEPVAQPRRARRRVDPAGQRLHTTGHTPPKPAVDDLLTPQPITAHPGPVQADAPPNATLVTEPLEDSFEDEAAARAKARDRAAVGSGPVAVTLQVVLAILAPLVILIAVLRLIASPLFLWFEYHRPGFPADQYGMDTEQRLSLGSYGMDYLLNFAPPTYLSDLRFANGNPVFTDGEVSHMVDVKAVMMGTMLGGLIAAIVCVVIMVLLSRMRKGAIARSFFAGAVWFTVALIVLAIVAALGWEAFFAGFHQLFFADGTWTFYTTDSLIRLYPGQFWIDAASWIAGLTVAIMVVIMLATAPTGRRRYHRAQAQRFLESQVTGEPNPQP